MDQEHLRLVRSLALSSSCDYGATCPPPGSILVKNSEVKLKTVNSEKMFKNFAAKTGKGFLKNVPHHLGI